MRRHGTDLLGALIGAADVGDGLTHDELFGLVQVLLIAGQETRAAQERLLARWPELALAPGPHPSAGPNFGLRSFAELGVILTPR